MKKRIITIFVYLIVILIISSCATAPKIQYTTDIQAKLTENSKSEQVKGGITVILEPVDDDIYKKSYFKQDFDLWYTPLLSSSAVKEKKEIFIEFFYGMTAFNVTIINDTDHILRMRDARIIFIDPNFDEPVFALDRAGIMDDMEILPIYDRLLETLTKKYSETKESFIEAQMLANLQKILKKLKFINGFNREIMPGMKLSGIVVFPVDKSHIAEGKISFIDMTSKTDNAGNPIEKVRFDYKIDTIKRFWKFDPSVDSEWNQITEKEYNAGNVNNQ